MKKFQKLKLTKMTFQMNHGVYEFEKSKNTTFEVNLTIYYDFYASMLSDQLEDTLDYQVLYELISKEIHIRANLIEHIAYRMVESISKEFEEILKLKLKISKMNPPIQGDIEKTEFEVKWKRKN
jgi:dihydroneopterin aldolase